MQLGELNDYWTAIDPCSHNDYIKNSKLYYMNTYKTNTYKIDREKDNKIVKS